MRKAISLLGIATLALALGACGGSSKDKAAEKAAEKMLEGLGGGNVDIDLDNGGNSGTITFDDEEGGGSFSFGGGEMPDELSYFPLPGDSTVIGVMTGSDSGGEGSMVTVAANGSFDEVVAGIKGGLEAEGYTVAGVYNAENNGQKSTMFSYEGNGQSVSVSVNEDTSNEGYNLVIGIITSTDTSGM